MATVGSHARLSNMRGFAVNPGTMSLVGPTPYGSGILNASLSGTITSNPIVLAASPTFGAEFGYVYGGGSTYGNVATLMLLNNGTTKQCVQVQSGTAPNTVGPTAGTVSNAVSGINVTTYQATFSTGNTTVSLIPAEYITSAGTTYLSAADAPPAVGGNCLRYNVICSSLPNIQVDIAESTHPTTPLGIVLKMGAEVQPFSFWAPYDFENSGIDIIQNTVATTANGGIQSIMLEAIFPGGNAWNNNTGLLIGHPKSAIHLAARYMTIINWVYTQYCLTTGAHYPSGASGNLPLTVWGGSGACAGIMLCCAYYGLGWRSDIYPTKIMLDSYGATVLTYREMSGLSIDNNYNPVVAAGTSLGGTQTVAEGLLDDQGASYPPSQGGNWNPTTLQPLGGLGDGQGPSYQNLFNSGWGPGGAYAGTLGALTVASGFSITSNTAPATFTASGTATAWPGALSASRDVNGIVTLPLTGGGTVLCSYNSIVTGSPNTFKGCTWSATGAVAGGASLTAGGTSIGYNAAGANLANQSDGPFALPATSLAPNNLALRKLRFIAGANDVSNLPVLLNTWLPTTPLSSSKYLWQVVPGAAHDIASSTQGAQALEGELFDQPQVLQNNSQTVGSATASITVPGWTVNGVNPHSIMCNAGTILFAVIWTSTATVPTAPTTTQSPASGIHSWQRIPAGISTATYTLPINSGTYGIVTVWSKVTTGAETAADLAFTVGSGTIWSMVAGECGIALDNPAEATSISVQNGGTTHTSTGNACYGVDVCTASVANATSVSPSNLAPTSTTRSISLAFGAANIAGDVTTPFSLGNNYTSLGLNGTASYALTPANAVGGTTGVLFISQKALLNTSSSINYTLSSTGATLQLGAGAVVFKGSTLR